MRSLLFAIALSLASTSAFAARADVSRSASERATQPSGIPGLRPETTDAPDVAEPADLTLDLKDVPDVVELPIAHPASVSGTSLPKAASSQTPTSAARSASRKRRDWLEPQGAAKAATDVAVDERSEGAVQLFSQWLGETRLKAGYADFDDGTRLHFAYRKGKGPAVLVVHGRAVGPEGFQRWADKMFPGRPVVLLQRRGYSGETERVYQEDVLRLHSSDVEKAIDIARKLSDGGKVGILTHSLGAMILPQLDPKKVAWLAMLNPGVYGMFREVGTLPKGAFDRWGRGDLFGGIADMFMNQLDLMNSNAQNFVADKLSQFMVDGERTTRWADPITRAHWIQLASRMILSGVEDRLGHMKEDADTLRPSLSRILKIREENPYWKESMIQESLWAALGRIDYVPWGKDIPVFLGTNNSDELIPQFVFDHLWSSLLDGRVEGLTLEGIRMAGTHLHPLFFPEAWLKYLHAFDQRIRAKKN